MRKKLLIAHGALLLIALQVIILIDWTESQKDKVYSTWMIQFALILPHLASYAVYRLNEAEKAKKERKP